MDSGLKVRGNWGLNEPLTPSHQTTQPLTWLALSALAALVVFGLAQAALWRPLPLLGEAPIGSFAEHASYWLRILAHKLFPTMFASDAAFYGRALEQLGAREGLFGLWARLSIGAALATLPAIAMARSYLTPREGQLHVRGGKRFEGSKAIRQLLAKLADSNKRRPDHLIHPQAPYPADQWTRHVLAIGGVGSGKSTVLRPLIKRVIDADEKLILFDPKGEFTQAFAKPILIAPWDGRSWAWDIARDLRNLGDVRRFAAALVREGKDPMWSNAARQVLVGYLLCLKEQRGTLWGWKELAEMLSTPEEDLLAVMERYNPEAIRAVEKASVTTTGILINLSAFCSPIFDLAKAWGDAPENRRVSFIEWAVARGPAAKQIILQGNGAYEELTRAYIEGIIGTLSALINSVEIEDDPTRKLWLIADEFAQMGKIPVKPLFEVGRSRGVRCVVPCQDLAQLEEIHGKETVKALVSMTGTLVVGRVGPGETAESLAKALGSREVERANLSSSYNGGSASNARSTTLSYSRDEVALYKPSELASRLGEDPKRGGCVLALATQGMVYELFWPYAPLAKEREAFEAAAWVSGTRSVKAGPAASGPNGAAPKAAPRASASLVGKARAAPAPRPTESTQEACPARSRQETLVSARQSSPAIAGEAESPLGAEAARVAIDQVASGAAGFAAGGLAAIALALDASRDARRGPRPVVSISQEAPKSRAQSRF